MDSSNRNEMQGNLFQQTSLETIRIHKSELKNMIFKNEGKEISFEGEMYDVKSISEKGDYIIFNCKRDKKETHLLAGFDKQVKNNSDSTTPEKKQNKTSKNPVKDLFFYKSTIFMDEGIAIEFPPSFCHFTSYISSPLPLPPPEVSAA